MATTSRKAVATLNAALAKVESKSIREWASSAHNLPHMLKFVEENLRAKSRVVATPEELAGFIVATAIGL